MGPNPWSYKPQGLGGEAGNIGFREEMVVVSMWVGSDVLRGVVKIELVVVSAATLVPGHDVGPNAVLRTRMEDVGHVGRETLPLYNTLGIHRRNCPG